MNAHATFPTLSPFWPLRWEAARGTDAETYVLMTITTDAWKAGEMDVFRAAYDAANSPDERAGFVEELERLFVEQAPGFEDDLVPPSHPVMRKAAGEWMAKYCRGIE